MRTVYHGTNASIISVINNPKANHSINGNGFYMTEDIDTARSYGRMYIKVIISDDLFSRGRHQPIDQRYTNEASNISYDECAAKGMEIVFSQDTARKIMRQGEVFKAYSSDMVEYPHGD